MYAKLHENGLLEVAPIPLTIGDRTILEPTLKDHKKAGYKEVRFTFAPEPAENQYVSFALEEMENEIRQVWTLHNIPETDDLEPAEALKIITGGLYE